MDPSNQETEAGGSEFKVICYLGVLGQPGLHENQKQNHRTKQSKEEEEKEEQKKSYMKGFSEKTRWLWLVLNEDGKYSKMVQQGKVFAAKTEDQSLVPGTLETGENQLPKLFWFPHVCGVHTDIFKNS